MSAGLTEAGAAECLNKALYEDHTCHALAFCNALFSLSAAFSHRCRARTCLTLSTVLSQSPQLFDDKKIGVVEKFITEIDLLPQRYHHVRVSLWACSDSLGDIEGFMQLLHHCSNAACVDSTASLFTLYRQCLASGSCALYV